MKLVLALCALLSAAPVGAKTIVFQATMYEVTLDHVLYQFKDGSDAGIYNFLNIHSLDNPYNFYHPLMEYFAGPVTGTITFDENPGGESGNMSSCFVGSMACLATHGSFYSIHSTPDYYGFTVETDGLYTNFGIGPSTGIGSLILTDSYGSIFETEDVIYTARYYNDFKFSLVEVPLPAAGWLLVAGLGAMGASRLRRRRPS